MALTYRQQGDYQIPNIFVPKQETSVGKYGMMRRTFLMNEKPAQFNALVMKGQLNQHLTEIDQKAMERELALVQQMALQEGVTEEMKATNQMRWVGLMNNFSRTAEEIVQAEMIYI